jgi:hypothetical protein
MDRYSFTPAWLAERDPAPVFFLRAASILDRDAFEAELEGRYRAGMVPGFLMLDAAIAGVRALVDGDDAEALIELIRAEYGGEKLPPEEQVKVKAATEILAAYWPDYAAGVEQEARRNAVLPTLAFLRWVDGWENLTGKDGEEIDYARSPRDGIADDLLRRIDPSTLRAAGLRAYAVQYGRTEAKN